MKKPNLSSVYLLGFLFLFWAPTFLQGQEFRAPMDIPLFLSGNFGELRSNHFHTGIDIKTQGKTGIRVYSAEDGKVFRIKVSTGGYGNALYIRHPNGYTTVYAHLQKFAPEIASALRREQYAQKKHTLDYFPPAGSLKVKKGDLIALSGNSGGSSGPHLHFEIRDSKTEEPVNPLLFNFPIKDDIPPSIYGMMLYPMDGTSHVNHEHNPANFACGGEFSNYRLKEGDQIEAHGRIGFGFHIIDRLNGYPNKCGFYHAQLFENSKLIWEQKMDRLNFATNRYINAHTDYKLFKKLRKSYHRFYKLPHNKLNIYGSNPGEGVVDIQGTEPRDYLLEVVDAYQNKSVFAFQITPALPIAPAKEEVLVNWEKDLLFQDDVYYFKLPAKALYSDAAVQVSLKSKKHKGRPIYTIGDPYTPLQKSFEFRLKIPELPDSLFSKLYAVRFHPEKGNPYPSGGTGKASTQELIIQSRNFGDYSYAIDTIAPKVLSMNLSANKVFRNGDNIEFKVQEFETGLDKYELYLNGKWVLLEYFPKRKKLIYSIEPTEISSGLLDLELILTDYVGNTTKIRKKIRVQ